MTRSPRAEALHILNAEQHPALPQIADPPSDTQPIQELINPVKPRQYAVLARLVDIVFHNSFDSRSSLIAYEQFAGDDWSVREVVSPWDRVSRDVFATLVTGLRESYGSEEYKSASEVCSLIGSLDPQRHTRIDTQMIGGFSTAINTASVVASSIPYILESYSTDANVGEYRQIAQRSVGVLRKLAKLSIDQMMAAQSVLADGEFPEWQSTDIRLDPSHFKVERDLNKEYRIAFADFDALSVEPGYTLPYNHATFPEQTRIRDIDVNGKVTIGCPVTLLQGRLGQLWSVYIEEADRQKAWLTT